MMLLRLSTLCALLSVLVGPAVSGAADVKRYLSDDVVMNWSEMRLERWAGGGAVGVGAKQGAVEQRLRERVGPALKQKVLTIHVGEVGYVSDLLDDTPVGKSLAQRVNQWSVEEAKYMASGRVEIMGAIQLHEFLRPWLISSSKAQPTDPAATKYTGLIIDARHLGHEPCFKPKVLDSDGVPMYDGVVWQQMVLETTPVLYVDDAADARAGRAGASPLMLKAADAGQCYVSIKSEDSEDVRVFSKSVAVGSGTIVMIVEAE